MTCAICREEYGHDQLMDCACQRFVCKATCWDYSLDRCEACSDNYWLSEDTVLMAISEKPGMTLDELAAELRGAMGELDPLRMPVPYWWQCRTRDLLKLLRQQGEIECAFPGCHTREERRVSSVAEVLPLCEWRLTEKGQKIVGA